MSSQSGSDSEDPADPVDELITSFDNVSVSEKIRSLGKWRSSHPWEIEKPNPKKLKMKASVANSKSYPISPSWRKKNGDVDLDKIFSNLPMFVESEMQGSINGSRQELEKLVGDILDHKDPLQGELSPHVREIVQILDESYRVNCEDDDSFFPFGSPFKARSIPYDGIGQNEIEEYLFYIDCENILKMYVPKSLISWFDIEISWFDIEKCERVQWIRKISYPNKKNRWMFTPSFRRAKIALLDWPEDEIVTESTIRILVVRPSEFKDYVKYCGEWFPIICLPQDVTGAGYPRYWIQKIAQHLKLQFIWMIDDSVECFYEYNTYPKYPQGSNCEYTALQFGLVFKRIEDFVKEADDSEYPIAAMSPRRWDPRWKPQQPFVCKPPQCAVYLNLRALSEKNVRYRPELKTFEDMMFGYECEKKGLKVYMDNRVHLQDHEWKNTGARSPSVKGKSKNSSSNSTV